MSPGVPQQKRKEKRKKNIHLSSTTSTGMDRLRLSGDRQSNICPNPANVLTSILTGDIPKDPSKHLTLQRDSELSPLPTIIGFPA